MHYNLCEILNQHTSLYGIMTVMPEIKTLMLIRKHQTPTSDGLMWLNRLVIMLLLKNVPHGLISTVYYKWFNQEQKVFYVL